MIDLPTTIWLIALAILSGTASLVAARRIRDNGSKGSVAGFENKLLVLSALGGMGLILYRFLWVHSHWGLLSGHVDGLVIVATLVAMALAEMHRRGRLGGLAAFAMPIHTLLLCWAICASAWTFRAFTIGSLVVGAHRTGIYLGAFCAVAAASGGMLFLFARRRLRTKQPSSIDTPLASLEAIERFTRRVASVGFILLTVGVVLGVFVASSRESRLGPMWWQSPKTALAVAVWLTYAAIAYGRYVVHVRAVQTAWLSIVGLVLVLATFGVANVVSSDESSAINRTPQDEPPIDAHSRLLDQQTSAKRADVAGGVE